jgi:hypothetical protein
MNEIDGLPVIRRGKSRRRIIYAIRKGLGIAIPALGAIHSRLRKRLRSKDQSEPHDR